MMLSTGLARQPARVHVIGAGLAGLSAAVALAGRDVAVVVSEAARQAGGRCRSFHDGLLDMVIDNGNHLVLSGNAAVDRYLRAIGAEGRLIGPRAGRISLLRPPIGPALDPASERRCRALVDSRSASGGCRARVLATTWRCSPCCGVIPAGELTKSFGATVFYGTILRPVLLSALNTAPEEASADLAGAIVRETSRKAGATYARSSRRQASPPLSSTPPLRSAGSVAGRTSGSAVRCGPCDLAETRC